MSDKLLEKHVKLCFVRLTHRASAPLSLIVMINTDRVVAALQTGNSESERKNN